MKIRIRTLNGLYKGTRVGLYYVFKPGDVFNFIIHIFFKFVKLMYKFFANSYENKEKNRVCQSLLQLVYETICELYPRYS